MKLDEIGQDYKDLFNLFKDKMEAFYRGIKLIERSDVTDRVVFNVVNIMSGVTSSEGTPVVVEGEVDLEERYEYLLSASLNELGVHYEEVENLTPIDYSYDGINPYLKCKIRKTNFFPPTIELEGVFQGDYRQLDYLDLRVRISLLGKKKNDSLPVYFHLLAEGIDLINTNSRMAFFYIFTGFESYINNPLQNSAISTNLSLEDKIKLHFMFKFNGIDINRYVPWNPIVRIFKYCKEVRDKISHGKKVVVRPDDLNYLQFLVFLVIVGIENKCTGSREYEQYLTG